MLKGAADMAPVTLEIQLVSMDVNDTVRLGLTAIPNAVPAGAGGLPTVDANNYVAGFPGSKNVLDDLNDGDATAANQATIEGKIDTLDTNVDTLVTRIPDTISLAAINAQADLALSDINLDHLVKLAVDTDFPTTVHLDSVVGHLADKGGSATFDRSTDSLEATAMTAATANGYLVLILSAFVDLANAIGPFTASGINNIYGFLLAMIKSDASTPSDIGGTFDPATDSVQALRDRGDAAWMTGGDATAAGQAAIEAKVDIIDGVVDDILADTADIQPNYATAAALAVVDGNVDTLITNVPDVISLAAINAQADAALSDIHLDHLLAVTYDPASKPGAADALLNELVEDDSGVSRYTANALEQAPTGGSAPTVDQIADEVETRTIAGVTTVTNLTNAPTVGDLTATMKASVNAEVDTALNTAIPGSPTADSINERVKAIDDKLPAGNIGDATAANQATMIADVATVDGNVDAILIDTADMQPKLGTPAADLAADVAAVKTDTAAILIDTADMQPKIGTPAADLSADVAAVKAQTAAIETDTQDIQGRLPAALVTGRMASDAVAISGSTAAADAVEANIANLDAAVTTRSSHSAADVWAAGSRTLTSFGTLAADVTTAVWAAGARTLTSFGTLVADTATAVWAAVARTLTAGTKDAEIDAILADTADMQPKLGTPAADLAADVAAVKSDTAAILLDTGTDGVVVAAASKTDYALSTDGNNAAADALLKRDVDQVEATAPVHSLTTVALAVTSKTKDDGGGNLEVYRTDGITVHMTKTVATDATLEPIQETGVGA